FLAAEDDGTLDLGTLLLEESSRIVRRKAQFQKYELHLLNGRDISIYATVRESDKCFMIFDVPTTLMTTLKAIDKVANSWGDVGGDQPFKDKLAEREAVTFKRAIATVVKEEQLGSGVKVIPMSEFEALAFEQP
ncbi:MAG: hypothetical protein ABSG46_13550, partial [Candidatus Binataceae bacterium]